MIDPHYDLDKYVTGGYWACEQPEKPPDEHTFYAPDCRACMVAYGASVRNAPVASSVFVWQHDPLSSNGWNAGSPAEVYERYRHRHDLPPLPCQP